MEKFSQFRDRGSGIAPFLPVPPQPSGYALPFHVFLFCFRLPLLVTVCLTYFVILQWLPIGSLGKKASLWCILGVPSLWWIDLQVDGVKRGSLAKQHGGRLPEGRSIIASSFTSPIDAIYLAAVFDPVFTASYPNTRKVEHLSLFQAILRAFAQPQVQPSPNAHLVELSDLLARYPNRPIAVFPECTTTNGRGILPLSPSIVADLPARTKVFPVSVRYTPADITTPVPASYFTFLWNLLSRPTHFIRVRVAEAVESVGRPSTSAALDSCSGDKDSAGLTKDEQAIIDRVGEALARLGRVKRVGLGVREKQEFVKLWNRTKRS
ncbi:hypothetical protein VTN31DRAFT_705 [Thermomyces dupontii]|uniref:uncharacterized protein n=1 Tax=Talaromyces thermophilus TaxID=28565 RepID=UPI003742B1F6